jgi:hypothetical protein
MKPWLLAVPACCLTVFGCAPAHTTVSMPLPAPEAAIEDASPQQEAAALMLRILAVTGGAGVWRAVANVVSELEAKLFTPEGERFATSKIVLRLPGDMHRANVLEGLGTIDMLVRGERTWFKPPQQDAIRSAEPFEAEYIQAGLWRELLFLLARVARGNTEGLQLSAMPDAERDGRRYHVLQVQPPRGLQGYRLYIDAAKGLARHARLHAGGCRGAGRVRRLPHARQRAAAVGAPLLPRRHADRGHPLHRDPRQFNGGRADVRSELNAYDQCAP